MLVDKFWGQNWQQIWGPYGGGARPFLLQANASYTQLGIFSLASYPYSFKLFWSPVVDSLYSSSFGRRKTWIVRPAPVSVGPICCPVINLPLCSLIAFSPSTHRARTAFAQAGTLCLHVDIPVSPPHPTPPTLPPVFVPRSRMLPSEDACYALKMHAPL